MAAFAPTLRPPFLIDWEGLIVEDTVGGVVGAVRVGVVDEVGVEEDVGVGLTPGLVGSVSRIARSVACHLT